MTNNANTMYGASAQSAPKAGLFTGSWITTASEVEAREKNLDDFQGYFRVLNDISKEMDETFSRPDSVMAQLALDFNGSLFCGAENFEDYKTQIDTWRGRFEEWKDDNEEIPSWFDFLYTEFPEQQFSGKYSVMEEQDGIGDPQNVGEDDNMDFEDTALPSHEQTTNASLHDEADTQQGHVTGDEMDMDQEASVASGVLQPDHPTENPTKTIFDGKTFDFSSIAVYNPPVNAPSANAFGQASNTPTASFDFGNTSTPFNITSDPQPPQQLASPAAFVSNEQSKANPQQAIFSSPFSLVGTQQSQPSNSNAFGTSFLPAGTAETTRHNPFAEVHLTERRKSALDKFEKSFIALDQKVKELNSPHLKPYELDFNAPTTVREIAQKYEAAVWNEAAAWRDREKDYEGLVLKKEDQLALDNPFQKPDYKLKLWKHILHNYDPEKYPEPSKLTPKGVKNAGKFRGVTEAQTQQAGEFGNQKSSRLSNSGMNKSRRLSKSGMNKNQSSPRLPHPGMNNSFSSPSPLATTVFPPNSNGSSGSTFSFGQIQPERSYPNPFAQAVSEVQQSPQVGKPADGTHESVSEGSHSRNQGGLNNPIDAEGRATDSSPFTSLEAKESTPRTGTKPAQQSPVFTHGKMDFSQWAPKSPGNYSWAASLKEPQQPKPLPPGTNIFTQYLPKETGQKNVPAASITEPLPLATEAASDGNPPVDEPTEPDFDIELDDAEAPQEQETLQYAPTNGNPLGDEVAAPDFDIVVDDAEEPQEQEMLQYAPTNGNPLGDEVAAPDFDIMVDDAEEPPQEGETLQNVEVPQDEHTPHDEEVSEDEEIPSKSEMPGDTPEFPSTPSPSFSPLVTESDISAESHSLEPVAPEDGPSQNGQPLETGVNWDYYRSDPLALRTSFTDIFKQLDKNLRNLNQFPELWLSDERISHYAHTLEQRQWDEAIEDVKAEVERDMQDGQELGFDIAKQLEEAYDDYIAFYYNEGNLPKGKLELWGSGIARKTGFKGWREFLQREFGHGVPAPSTEKDEPEAADSEPITAGDDTPGVLDTAGSIKGFVAHFRNLDQALRATNGHSEYWLTDTIIANLCEHMNEGFLQQAKEWVLSDNGVMDNEEVKKDYDALVYDYNKKFVRMGNSDAESDDYLAWRSFLHKSWEYPVPPEAVPLDADNSDADDNDGGEDADEGVVPDEGDAREEAVDDQVEPPLENLPSSNLTGDQDPEDDQDEAAPASSSSITLPLTEFNRLMSTVQDLSARLGSVEGKLSAQDEHRAQNEAEQKHLAGSVSSIQQESTSNAGKLDSILTILTQMKNENRVGAVEEKLEILIAKVDAIAEREIDEDDSISIISQASTEQEFYDAHEELDSLTADQQTPEAAVENEQVQASHYTAAGYQVLGVTVIKADGSLNLDLPTQDLLKAFKQVLTEHSAYDAREVDTIIRYCPSVIAFHTDWPNKFKDDDRSCVAMNITGQQLYEQANELLGSVTAPTSNGQKWRSLSEECSPLHELCQTWDKLANVGSLAIGIPDLAKQKVSVRTAVKQLCNEQGSVYKGPAGRRQPGFKALQQRIDINRTIIDCLEEEMKNRLSNFETIIQEYLNGVAELKDKQTDYALRQNLEEYEKLVLSQSDPVVDKAHTVRGDGYTQVL